MTDLIPSSMHRRRASRVAGLLLCALIAGTAASHPAHAVVELNITQGNIQAMPIAIPDFSADGSIDANTAREISNVVANDLKSSGLFLPIDQAAFIEKGKDLGARWVVTFVTHDNVPSLKGCQRSGFSPYLSREERWQAFMHSVTFTPLPEGTPYSFE